ncbi:MAG: hypothetical protein LUC83_07650 [Clostridiales bacterium]|nr:hypothetical protein [Clostridiales bacterium]
MKKSRKILLSCLVLAVIVTCTVSPTFSWLSAKSEQVVNTFAGGTIAVTLDEAETDEYGNKKDGEERVTENAYKYTAGAELYKDPTVTVLADSEACYVYLCVENQLPVEYFTINYDTKSWNKVDTYEQEDGTVLTVYRYKTVIAASDGDQELEPIFTIVTVSDELTQEEIEALGTKTVKVQAYAVQTAELEETSADELALEFFGIPTDTDDGDEDTGDIEDNTANTVTSGSSTSDSSTSDGNTSGDTSGSSISNDTADSGNASEENSDDASDASGSGGDSNTSGGSSDDASGDSSAEDTSSDGSTTSSGSGETDGTE